MTIVDRANINLASLVLSNPYVVITPPQNLVIPGVPTSLAGIVGTASRGPVNSPQIIGTPADLIRTFGTLSTETYDLVTEALMAMKQGANNLVCVRVTDGTDVKATNTLRDNAGTPATLVTLTATSSGTWANSLRATLAAGTNSTTSAKTYKVILEMPGEVKEVFDNIGGANMVAVAANIVSAINNGQNGVRPPSQYVTASTAYAGVATSATFETRTLAGGTNGNSSVNAASLVGTDGSSSTRTGMYALRATGIAQFILAGNADSTSYASQLAFAVDIGALVILTQPTGTASDVYITNKSTAGIDNYHAHFVKDWLYLNDTVNGSVRLVSPLGATLGKIATLSPEQSPGNKELYGIVATERTKSGLPYSDAELSSLEANGICPITNPIPRGKMFGLRNGQNSSSDPTVNGVNYTRMTFFLANSLNNVLGQLVCEPHTSDLRRKAKSAIQAFLSDLQDKGMIGDPNGGPAFSVICDETNNPDSQVALGYLNITVQVRYLSIARFIVCSLEGGQTVKPIVSAV